MFEISSSNTTKARHKSRDWKQDPFGMGFVKTSNIIYGKSRGVGQNSHACFSQPRHRDMTRLLGIDNSVIISSNNNENRAENTVQFKQ